MLKKYGNVEDQPDFGTWRERLELNNPARFLPHLGNIVDVPVQDDWWIDRDWLQSILPVN